MRPKFDFTGKVALVCGAGVGGIGAPTAQLLSAAGAYVVAVDHTPELARGTQELLEAGGGKCLPLVADLRDRAATADVVKTVRAELGRIDLLANIAGGTKQGHTGALEHTPDEVFDDTIALNLTYAFQICRDAGRLMIERGEGGAIVNIASVSGLASAPFHSVYGAAKAGLIRLTQSIAVEWGRFGIRANAVAPGSVRTARALATGAKMDERAQEWAPLGKPVEPQDIANATLFLLSDLAASITGQTIVVDNGVSARCPIGGLEYLGPRFDAEHWKG